MSELDTDLLIGILQRREPGLLHEVVLLGLAASEDQAIVEIQSVVGLELLEVGVGADGEPNQFGLKLDDQIGALGMLRDE